MWVFGRSHYQHSSIRKAARRPKSKIITTNSYKKLLTLSKDQSGVMRVDLLRGITTFKKKVSVDEIAHAVHTQDFSKIQRSIPWEDLPLSIAGALDTIGETAEMAGLISAEKLPPNMNERLRWDLQNPAIKNYIKNRTAKLVVGIQGDTQEVIQNFVARSFTESMSPLQVARQIKGSIGLYPAQERALANYRASMIGQGVIGGKLDRMVDAQESKYLDYRSMMIARTEIRGATNSGQLSVWKEAANQDLFDRTRAERVWVAEGPDPCDDCLAMDGVTTTLDDPWIMPDGTAVDCPPWDVHPHCYCGMELQFNVFDKEE